MSSSKVNSRTRAAQLAKKDPDFECLHCLIYKILAPPGCLKMVGKVTVHRRTARLEAALTVSSSLLWPSEEEISENEGEAHTPWESLHRELESCKWDQKWDPEIPRPLLMFLGPLRAFAGAAPSACHALLC